MIEAPPSPPTRWYPVYTHPRAEKKAYEALLNKGITAYLPLRRTRKQWSDRKKWVEEPLLRSYIFVQITPMEQASVLMTKGIARFIYFSGNIATMPDRQIADLKLVIADSPELEVTEQYLQTGEKVRIKAGPLMGLEGEMVAYRGQKQLALRFEHIGHTVIISANATLVERI